MPGDYNCCGQRGLGCQGEVVQQFMYTHICTHVCIVMTMKYIVGYKICIFKYRSILGVKYIDTCLCVY